MFIVTSQEMREMDRLTIESFGIPGIVLMENAGRATAQVLLREIPHLQNKKVGVMAGKGNNGGDGFVIARYLAENGVCVTIYLLTQKEKVKGDAASNLYLIEKMNIPVEEVPDSTAFASYLLDLTQHDLWVDAILGTGLQSDITGLYKEVIDFLNCTGRPIFAVDIPSGVNSDTGQVCGICTKATTTVTFGLPKIGHVIYPGRECVGNLSVVDIGIPQVIIDQVSPKHKLLLAEDIACSMKSRLPEMHKGSAGHLLVVGGSPGKTGAAAMTCLAAMRTGAGLVTLGTAKSLNDIMEIKLTEAMTAPLPETEQNALGISAYDEILSLLNGKKALAIGPGLGTASETENLVRRLLTDILLPTVVDADGLNALQGHLDLLKKMKVPPILTPHPGEMGHLLSMRAAEIQKKRISIARDFASEYQVFLVLKGACTIIADPEGGIIINPTGNPGMASGGMGDVLTGIIAGLLVQGYTPLDASRLAVYIHGASADALAKTKGPIGYLASDVIKTLPELMKSVSESLSKVPEDIPLIRKL
jgi:NAD(P)H-hydrate epimerase